jgi:hypothetical protein
VKIEDRKNHLENRVEQVAFSALKKLQVLAYGGLILLGSIGIVCLSLIGLIPIALGILGLSQVYQEREKKKRISQDLPLVKSFEK